MLTKELNGKDFSKMIKQGALNLKRYIDKVNDLNVFPIPDGDTGNNMFLTILGGVRAIDDSEESLSVALSKISEGMNLSARGNSGVILAQFFSGMNDCLTSAEAANSNLLQKALMEGARKAYKAVATPTEGTILTVMRQGAEYATKQNANSPYSVLEDFLKECRIALKETPEKLYVLKQSGVVDSGGAGFVYILEGMLGKNNTSDAFDELSPVIPDSNKIDYSQFDENSVLEFGYCVEALVRLQNSKTDISRFNEKPFIYSLNEFGDSVVTFKNDSLLKIHIHTHFPHKILEFCQRYGEFLEVKIENMSLQHNSKIVKQPPKEGRKPFGIVSVCFGEGIQQMFLDRGVDVIIDGGQTMNPSTEDFLKAFKKINAETIFVFPNNSNILLTAKLAASMYNAASIQIIESETLGEGYSALAMFDSTITDASLQKENFYRAMEGVITCCVSQSVKKTEDVNIGEYIGFIGKEIIFSQENRFDVAVGSIDKIDLSHRDICIIIYGKNVDEKEKQLISTYLSNKYSKTEIFSINGNQDIYDYIFIIE